MYLEKWSYLMYVSSVLLLIYKPLYNGRVQCTWELGSSVICRREAAHCTQGVVCLEASMRKTNYIVNIKIITFLKCCHSLKHPWYIYNNFLNLLLAFGNHNFVIYIFIYFSYFKNIYYHYHYLIYSNLYFKYQRKPFECSSLNSTLHFNKEQWNKEFHSETYLIY